MTFQDILLLAKKILVGIVVTLIPTLIIIFAINFLQKLIG
ncbi:hypothetical protein SAMN05661044_04968 [Olivibacter domesticus]|uniref:Uncharacterized protein n=1 Tax=Olivibacter domesticus TaxID=407022 RepID=A0A1H7XRU7_OLID1|nr:hypothetical protein SAMN05661044_04968 [Olivibacter domesticus]